MSQRAEQLHASADQQIGGLIDTLATVDAATLRRPCARREKLGDGTIGAFAAHTADNYRRIGTFVATSDRMSARHRPQANRGHQIPSLLRRLGHTPPDDSEHAVGGRGHNAGYTADSTSPPEIIQRLATARKELAGIAGLSDQQLDAVPPKDSFRFCDGKRTLEQVLAGLFKHQDHQVQTIKATVTANR
jgi:hypothetical protein